MSYYFVKTVNLPFQEAVDKATEALAGEGFGVLSVIDVRETLKKKIDVDFRPYRILGACNPAFAYKALQAEDKVGVMLTCNVIVQQTDDGRVEVAAVDPAASMSAIENAELGDIASEVRARLEAVIASV